MKSLVASFFFSEIYSKKSNIFVLWFANFSPRLITRFTSPVKKFTWSDVQYLMVGTEENLRARNGLLAAQLKKATEQYSLLKIAL